MMEYLFWDTSLGSGLWPVMSPDGCWSGCFSDRINACLWIVKESTHISIPISHSCTHKETYPQQKKNKGQGRCLILKTTKLKTTSIQPIRSCVINDQIARNIKWQKLEYPFTFGNEFKEDTFSLITEIQKTAHYNDRLMWSFGKIHTPLRKSERTVSFSCLTLCTSAVSSNQEEYYISLIAKLWRQTHRLHMSNEELYVDSAYGKYFIKHWIKVTEKMTKICTSLK